MAAEAFIFDLDGTIWDSRPWYASLLSDEGQVERIIAEIERGKPVASMLRRAGVTPAKFRSLCEGRISGLPIYSGVRKGLRALSRRSLPIGIVTNLPLWIVDPMLKFLGLEVFFHPVVAYCRTRRHKPHPDPLLLAVQLFGLVSSGDIWYVGDSAHDCQAAHSAGLSFAWASYGYGREEPPGADAILTRFWQVQSL